MSNAAAYETDLFGLMSLSAIFDPFFLIRKASVTYDVTILLFIRQMQALTKEKTWYLVEQDFKNWIRGNHDPETIYNEDNVRTQVIKESYIGQTVEKAFFKKNEKAVSCSQWQGMTNIAIKLPDFFTVVNVATNSIIPITRQSAKEILRFAISLQHGSTAFVGSVSAEVSVQEGNDVNGSFVMATFRIINVVSSQSYYLRLPDHVTGKPLKDWKQIYTWNKRIPCSKTFYTPNPQPCPNNYWPSTPFPVNIGF